ncbi:energy transducer TonB [Flavobacterium sp. H122]|uniref:energy transducer TonB n=1 Tax=Flavobacterium sp. H122 TaxID=2529860 RepID=UPI0010AB06DF|nr:energy transducer TonB [Flavobacterium sp. H122]
MKKILLFLAFFVTQISLAQASMSAIEKSAPIPYDSVENQPIYPGGINEFMKFIGKNFQAPTDENFSGGILKVSFVIEVNGSVSDIKILNDLGHGTAQEITRILQMCPKWNPADHEGKPARVLFTLPVTIRI